jgi:hypothetical protein
MLKKIPTIPNLCEEHEDELISIEEMIERYDELTEVHIEAQRGLATLSPEWCWRRDLGVRATFRAGKLRTKLWMGSTTYGVKKCDKFFLH